MSDDLKQLTDWTGGAKGAVKSVNTQVRHIINMFNQFSKIVKKRVIIYALRWTNY